MYIDLWHDDINHATGCSIQISELETLNFDLDEQLVCSGSDTDSVPRNRSSTILEASLVEKDGVSGQCVSCEGMKAVVWGRVCVGGEGCVRGWGYLI